MTSVFLPRSTRRCTRAMAATLNLIDTEICVNITATSLPVSNLNSNRSTTANSRNTTKLTPTPSHHTTPNPVPTPTNHQSTKAAPTRTRILPITTTRPQVKKNPTPTERLHGAWWQRDECRRGTDTARIPIFHSQHPKLRVRGRADIRTLISLS